MNLTKLFDTQRILDERIVREKGLETHEVLSEKILALLVELGELANEERSWKFWSEDREPRNLEWHAKNITNKFPQLPPVNRMLVEYVDNLHFILSLGLELHPSIGKMEGWQDDLLISLGRHELENVKCENVDLFNLMFSFIVKFGNTQELTDYGRMFSVFVVLGKSLGFTWEQIETAYYEKNAVNHARQDNGY